MKRIMKQTYKIAEKNIEIDSLFPEIHAFCSDYVTNQIADFSVKISEQDIVFEREKSVRERIAEGLEIINYPDSYLETLAVYRKIADKMLSYETMLFHGSAIAVDGQAYLFTAKSGTGKSTHTRLWREVFGDRAVMVNDDKPLLKVTDSGVTVFGTPWNGKHRLGKNNSAPLKAICILERGETNEISIISTSDALPKLIQQMYRSQDHSLLSKSLELISKLVHQIPIYNLYCNISYDAVNTAYNGMK